MNDAEPSALNLRPEDIDRLGHAVLTLARELWVTKDRLRILEAALAEAGVTTPAVLDAWQPDETLSDELAAERRRLIDGLLAVLANDDA